MNIIDRFKNQNTAQKIHFKNRKKGNFPSRIEKCFKLKQDRTKQVALKKKPDAKRASYNGLQSCGSVWACPVCSSIISERRKVFLQKAIDIWREKDPCNVVAMITFTTPHYIFQSLKEVSETQDKAMKIMKNQPQRGRYKVYKTIMNEMLSIGSYTGREVTYGRNGWHPHRHELNFSVRATIEQLVKWRDELAHAFLIAFEKAGGKINDSQIFLNRSIKIDQITDNDGYERISSYIAKVEGSSWTLAQEATKGIVKTAKNGNITPFGMLEAINDQDKKTKLYERKFFEYTQTMHGKKQFFPSNGLNAFLGLNWLTDDELMKENQKGNHYAFLTDPEWHTIKRLNIRGEIIELSEGRNDFEFLRDLETLLKEFELYATG